MQSVAWYRKVSLRGALSAFAIVVALQLGLWIAYEQVRENRHIIAVIEGAMYALVYAVLAAGMILYGTRASRIYQTIAGATLTVRLRSSGNVFFQATTAGIALTLRAFVGLAAAIGAAFFWDSDDVSGLLYQTTTIVIVFLYCNVESYLFVLAGVYILGCCVHIPGLFGAGDPSPMCYLTTKQTYCWSITRTSTICTCKPYLCHLESLAAVSVLYSSK
jgi:hypothetical protein